MTTPNIQIRDDLIDAGRADALRITLGMTVPIGIGSTLPPFFHYAFFWDPQSTEALGRDGHPKLGGFVPDMGLPRRMWAGGRLHFLDPLLAGRPAQKRSYVTNSERKVGRSGPLGFVTLCHEIWQAGRCCVREEQDLVYRAEATPDSPKPEAKPAPLGGDVAVKGFSTTQLFRYSALTFNGHRIHYDRDYARDVEGYDGLVVHGPLLAQHLMLIAEEKLGGLSYFEFRGLSAVMDTEEVTLCWDNGAAWVRGGDGRLCLNATAR